MKGEILLSLKGETLCPLPLRDRAPMGFHRARAAVLAFSAASSAAATSQFLRARRSKCGLAPSPKAGTIFAPGRQGGPRDMRSEKKERDDDNEEEEASDEN
jgi:hypothetical protein